MNIKVKDCTLLDSMDKENLMVKLVVLKIATTNLEKENWYTVPYAGQNFIQDVLFQTKLTVRCLWDDFFLKKGIDYKNNKLRLQNQIDEMCRINPDLKLNYQLIS